MIVKWRLVINSIVVIEKYFMIAKHFQSITVTASAFLMAVFFMATQTVWSAPLVPAMDHTPPSPPPQIHPSHPRLFVTTETLPLLPQRWTDLFWSDAKTLSTGGLNSNDSTWKKRLKNAHVRFDQNHFKIRRGEGQRQSVFVRAGPCWSVPVRVSASPLSASISSALA
ncbi:MAG: hypothetical protein NTX50_08120 [Candidatus Sumerlaeota bacterium]|nr:hypothetical protein [Candidatus Sumerlaeota bacterium]